MSSGVGVAMVDREGKGGGGGGGGKPVQITGARGPTMLLMFLSFSVVSLFVHCTN